jgi:3-hydroxybutyryl-CoA dehydrogenase
MSAPGFVKLSGLTRGERVARPCLISAANPSATETTPVSSPRAAVRLLGIVGSGPVACAIALAAARRGCEVTLVDPRPGAVEEALASVQRSATWLAARGRLDGTAPATVLARVHGSKDPAALADAPVVVEAIPDGHEAKLVALRHLDERLAEDVVIATVTTTDSVSHLAAVAKHPERVVGLHFVEAGAGEVVEVVRALQTAPESHEAAVRFVRALGKTAISVADRPGFLVYRMLIPFINEACFALQEGLGTAEDIDLAARVGGEGQGPLRMADVIGLDRCLLIAEQLQREFGDDKYRPAPLLRNYVAAGWLGRKASRGFYQYPG